MADGSGGGGEGKYPYTVGFDTSGGGGGGRLFTRVFASTQRLICGIGVVYTVRRWWVRERAPLKQTNRRDKVVYQYTM